MSLIKQIELQNGACATYHRIKSLIKNYSTIEVTVSSYSDATYRDKEKEFIDLCENRSNLIYELSVLTALSSKTAEQDSRILQIQNEIAKINDLSHKTFELFITKHSFSIIEDDILSFETIYDKLKTETEMFLGAQDC